eukprot:403347556
MAEQINTTSTGKRQRVDSIISGALSESAGFKRMRTGDVTWGKIDKIISKPSTQLILFEVPKGFNISDLNNLKEPLNLKKRLEKSQQKGQLYVKTELSSSNEENASHKNLMIGIESLKEGSDSASQFSGGAHITQLLTLLPQTKDDSEGNLKVSKGISGYVKVTSSVINKQIDAPHAKNVIRAQPKRSALTQVSNLEAGEKKSEKKAKK